MYRLFILAKCDLGHAEGVGEKVAELEDVSEVYSVTGEYDLLIKVNFDDLQSISDFVQDRLHRVPHLKETQTMTSFRVYGQDIGDFVN
ncbi:MAG: Lrp/AsnC ligand binding domain-containing protein [Pacificimonas sp.]|jgi:DNA-binding Lrp family transcriptional regulator|nr:Lrp/AsnC ligand binding domain-containing protein [Pacificimonas sp.]